MSSWNYTCWKTGLISGIMVLEVSYVRLVFNYAIMILSVVRQVLTVEVYVICSTWYTICTCLLLQLYKGLSALAD